MNDSYYQLGSWKEYAAKYNMMAPVPTPESINLDPSTSALIVVDAQRKAWDRDSKAGWSHVFHEKAPELAEAYFNHVEQTIIPNIQKLLSFFRQRSLHRLFFTMGPFLPNAADIPRSTYGRVASNVTFGDDEYQIMEALAPESGELVFPKNTESGFIGTGADLILRNLGVETLILVGGTSSSCVNATGRTGADLGFRIVLVEDAVSGFLPLLHDATLIQFSYFLGRVISTDQVIQELIGHPTDTA